MKLRDKEKGAWIIHHTNKVERFDSHSGFNKLYIAGKAGKLLSAITESHNQAKLSKAKLDVLADACKINSLEIDGVLKHLKNEQLIDEDSQGNIETLGITSTGLLVHTSSLFENLEPTIEEKASLTLSEYVSEAPVEEKILKERISDEFKLESNRTDLLFSKSEKYRIVDFEKFDDKKLIFNGNLFRRDSIGKTEKILSSLSSEEQLKITELNNLIDNEACVKIQRANQVLGNVLFSKLHHISFYDVSSISNEKEVTYLVTRPESFAKYGNGAVDDALDLAKLLVTSLSYGMKFSSAMRGRITQFEKLIQKLIDGAPVGPAPAICQDYKALEHKGVVSIKYFKNKRKCLMRLLKKDVGILALEVLKNGSASESVVFNQVSNQVNNYISPEENRDVERQKEIIIEDQKSIAEKLSVLRS